MDETKTVFDDFLSLEEDLGVFEKEIEETYFWERIRFNVYRNVVESKGLLDKAHSTPSRGISGRLKLLYRLLSNIIYRNPFLFSKKEILFWGHSRRKKNEDGLWEDIYCDPLIENFAKDYAYIEELYMLDHKKPAKTENIRYIDVIKYGSRLIYLIFGRFYSPFNQNEIEFLSDIEDNIDEKFDVSMDIEQKVHRSLFMRKVRLPMYDILLNRIDPRIAVVVVSYGRETFVEACQKKNIPVVEFQHGIIGKYHMGYSYPEGREKRSFPDYFFSFGDYWTDLTREIMPAEVRSVGYPYIEQKRSKYRQIDTKDQIIFISQRSIGEKLSKFALELSKKTEGYKIVYKLHPGEFSDWQERYPYLKETNIEVVANEKDLYRLFAESKIQLGVYSTAIYEGLGFNLKTFLLDVSGVKSMEDLTRKNYCKIVDSPEEVVKNLDGLESQNIETEIFFRPNAKERITKQIDRILNI